QQGNKKEALKICSADKLNYATLPLQRVCAAVNWTKIVDYLLSEVLASGRQWSRLYAAALASEPQGILHRFRLVEIHTSSARLHRASWPDPPSRATGAPAMKHSIFDTLSYSESLRC
ncbi:unnamed protein product, partial [Polarella glacialis]